MNFSARSRKTRGFAEAYFSYAAQKTPRFDAEIAEKGHLWMETREEIMPETVSGAHGVKAMFCLIKDMN